MPSGGLVSNYAAGVYRSKDSIRNFKIKVTLKRATGGSIKEITENIENVDGVALKELKKLQQKLLQNTDKHGKEEAVVSWQMKIFSKCEFEKYLRNTGESILEKNYNEECKSLNEKGYQPSRIFTYIDADPFQYVEEVNDDIERTPLNQIPNFLVKADSNLRKRRPLIGKSKSNEVALPKMNIVNYTTNQEEKKHLNSTKYQKMYIMADLSPNLDGFSQHIEYVLCTIKVDANGTIIVKPDFNDASRPYVVETGGYGNEAYEFIIENVSNQITVDDLKREFRLHQELYKRHIDYVKNLVGTDFFIPQPKILNVHVFGEIISAKNFDYDDLHVYYQLDLPKNWHSDTSQAMSGFTTTSRSICIDDDEIAYYSHPFEFNIYYSNDEMNVNYKDELPNMPKIYFEVASYDSWSRYRTEGYTWLQLKPQPGTYNEKLPCWRPRGDSFIYELRRFFIGGSPELEDISYVAVPSNHENSILSRFGFRTTTTGILDVKLNVLFQSQTFMDKKLKNKKHTQLIDKISNDTKLHDIMTVLDAFNQAKNRMKEARENTRKILEN